jgi:hypothetical protein
MYHLELRQFPHNMCRFNLTKEELLAVVEPWAHDQWVELGERRWSPHQAKLTIVEGPRIPVEQLTMGRGWRQAQRNGAEVTERLLADARSVGSAATQAPVHDVSAQADLLADSLGLELLTLLDERPAPPAQAWTLACARCPERTASECLALAEQAVRSLLRSRLIVLVRSVVDPPGSGGEGGGGEEVPEDEHEDVLRAVESWAGQGETAPVAMRRV